MKNDFVDSDWETVDQLFPDKRSFRVKIRDYVRSAIRYIRRLGRRAN